MSRIDCSDHAPATDLRPPVPAHVVAAGRLTRVFHRWRREQRCDGDGGRADRFHAAFSTARTMLGRFGRGSISHVTRRLSPLAAFDPLAWYGYVVQRTVRRLRRT